ncbi:hypothetical protein [Teichococcus deserti]|uniref:hypothetical protein n=1 Tax=Teichococcus deserti TaxID=1817963 RepID=UPI001054C0B9|nr:hypothetical protein [Pseudoroseomonas deserti]
MENTAVFKCNIENCIVEEASGLIEGWIFCRTRLGYAPIQKMRLSFIEDRESIEFPTMPRPDVNHAHALGFENSGFKISSSKNIKLGNLGKIEALVYDEWVVVPMEIFFARGFMWLCSEPSISYFSLIHDIGNYETRLQGTSLKIYLGLLLSKLERDRSIEYSLEAVGQILSTSFYQLGFSSLEKFYQLHYLSGYYLSNEINEYSRWRLSVNTSKIHCMLFHGMVAEAKSSLTKISETLTEFKKDPFLYYNFVKSQLMLATLYLIDGEKEKCVSTCAMVRDAAFEASSVLPRTYSMASEIRDIMVCAQQSFVVAHHCGVNDGGLDYPEALNMKDVLAACLRVTDSDLVHTIQRNIGIQ